MSKFKLKDLPEIINNEVHESIPIIDKSCQDKPKKLFQCPYHQQITCSMEYGCRGCEDFEPNLTKLQINQVFDVAIGNNDGIYYPESNVRFTVASRDKYPQRQFVTQSLYEFNKTLPSQSYYQIVDVDTNEAVIPFNNPGTLISANKAGSYFRVDMNTLEPERYYTVQVKVNIDGSTYVKSQTDMKFKVSQTV